MAKRRISPVLVAFLLLLAIAVGFVCGFVGYALYRLPKSDEHPGEAPYVEHLSGVANGDFEINFLELGNKYTGDCTYLRAGTTDVLIDAGSRTSSISTIADFLHAHMQDNVLDYVIVTHAHQDHYAGFATSENQDSLFDLFQVGTIIDFALTNQEDTATMYQNYQRELSEEIAAGAKHYTARDCIEQNKDIFALTDNVSMQVLDSKYYYEATSDENDYSVCLLFTQGDYHYLFTGDLEADGEAGLVSRNTLPEVLLYKAGHHGSKSSSSEELMSVIKPKIVCVCCCAGSPEYTKTDANQFPTQEFVDRVAPYTKLVYVTTLCLDYSAEDAAAQYASMNGNICVSVKDGILMVKCSSTNRVLKDWDWFAAHRTTPAAWK